MVKRQKTSLIFVIFLHRQNFWRIKFTPKNANFCQFFALNLWKFTPAKKIYTGAARGARDKYEVWTRDQRTRLAKQVAWESSALETTLVIYSLMNCTLQVRKILISNSAQPILNPSNLSIIVKNYSMSRTTPTQNRWRDSPLWHNVCLLTEDGATTHQAWWSFDQKGCLI